MDVPDQPIRRLFLQAADAAIAYRNGIADQPQRPLRTYDDFRATADTSTPVEGRPADEVIAELIRFAEGGLAAMTGPRFFAWVIGAFASGRASPPTGSPAPGARTPATIWHTPAAACRGDRRALAARYSRAAARRRRSALSPARRWQVSSASPPRAAMCCAAPVGTSRPRACSARPPSQRRDRRRCAHDGFLGAAACWASAHGRVHRVATDAQAACSRRLRSARSLDGSRSRSIAIAQAGQINTGAFDPVGEIADDRSRPDAWLHVDGAFGLWARACPEKRRA